MYRVYTVEFRDGTSATMLTDLADSETVEGATNAAIERFGARRVANVHVPDYHLTKAKENAKNSGN